MMGRNHSQLIVAQKDGRAGECDADVIVVDVEDVVNVIGERASPKTRLFSLSCPLNWMTRLHRISRSTVNESASGRKSG